MSVSRSAEDEQLDMGQAFRQHWVLFLVEGIVLLILGVLAVVIPTLATLAFTVFFGCLFVISGVFGLVTTFGAKKFIFWPNRAISTKLSAPASTASRHNSRIS